MEISESAYCCIDHFGLYSHSAIPIDIIRHSSRWVYTDKLSDQISNPPLMESNVFFEAKLASLNNQNQ